MLKKRNLVPELAAARVGDLAVRITADGEPMVIKDCAELVLGDRPSGEINYQLKAILKTGRIPVLHLDEGEIRLTPVDFANLISRRLANALAGLGAAAVARLVICYSPSWAGECRLPADVQRIQIAHRQIRDLLQILYDQETAKQVQIYYGGFVFNEELAAVLNDSNVDGVLNN